MHFPYDFSSEYFLGFEKNARYTSILQEKMILCIMSFPLQPMHSTFFLLFLLRCTLRFQSIIKFLLNVLIPNYEFSHVQ